MDRYVRLRSSSHLAFVRNIMACAVHARSVRQRGRGLQCSYDNHTFKVGKDMDAITPEDSSSMVFWVPAADQNIRLHIHGPLPQLSQARERIEAETDEARSADWNMGKIVAVLSASSQVSLVEKINTTQRARSLITLIRAISHSRTASIAHKRLVALFNVADDDEEAELLISRELAWVQSYIRSVVDDLDDNSARAADELRSEMSNVQLALILLPPDEG